MNMLRVTVEGGMVMSGVVRVSGDGDGCGYSDCGS